MQPRRVWLIALAAIAASASAQQTDRVLAGPCYGCHAPIERTDSGAIHLPALAGQSAASIEKALLDYRSDRRSGTLMNRIAKGYSEAQLRALARHFGNRARD